jgi:site-specific DNA recombinase
MPAQQLKNLKYFIYARKSTEDEEKQQLSIPAQITELKQFAKDNKLKVVEILTETKSAKTPGRKIFNLVLEKIEKQEAQGILSWHPDRLARNAVDAGQVGHLLNTSKLLDLKFPSFWFEKTPQGLFMLNMAFSQSQYFSDSLSVNTARGLRQKARLGHFPGVAPRGYLNNRAKKTIKVDPKQAPLITKLFRLYSQNKYTLGAVSQKMLEFGLKTPNNNPLKRDAIKKILTNPFYYGDFFYSGELYEGKHQPLISKNLFDKVQSVLANRSKPRKIKREKVFPFTGLIKCGYCGMGVTAEVQVKRFKSTPQKKYIYYRCSRKNKKVKCNGFFVRQPDLDQQLSNIIRSVSLNEKDGQWMLDRIYKERQAKTDYFVKFIEDLNTKVLSLEQQLERLLKLYMNNDIDRENYLKTKKTIVAQKRDFERKIIDLQTKPDQWLEPMEKWVKLALQARKIANLNHRLRLKRDFLLKTGSNLTLKAKKVYSNWPIPWAALCAAATSRSVEPGEGLEPTTCGLRHRRSTK